MMTVPGRGVDRRPEGERRIDYRWTILAVGVVAQGALSAVQQGLPALGPALRDELGLSLSQVGLVFACTSWGTMATLLMWGALADRYGERIVIAVGLLGGAAGLVAASQASAFGSLLAALVVAGALGGAASTASGSAVVGWFAREQRGFALGVRQTAVPLGGAVAALTLPVAAAAGGLSAALLVLAAGSVVGALAAAIWIREAPPPPANRPRPPKAPSPLRDRRVWQLAFGSSLLLCAQISIVSFVVLFLHDHRGVGAESAAAALAGIQLGGAAARLLAGHRSDRIGRRIAPMRRLAVATAVGVGAVAMLADAPMTLLVPVLLAAGIVAMSWNALSFTATAEISGRDQAGMAIGLQQTVMRAITAGAGIGFGALAAATSWPAAFALLAALPLAGWWVMRPLEGDEEERVRVREARHQDFVLRSSQSADLRTTLGREQR
jgi:sugar phosphate permease